jgi:uncharacterized membrane protein YgaE (UPF0421/DUF939 family)
MIGLLIAIIAAALVFWFCTFIGLPYIIAVIAAILVLLAGFPLGAYRRGGL